MIVLIIGQFLIFAKFCEISRKYQNFAKKSKICGSVRNTAENGGPWL